MTEDTETALRLMRMALALLDRADEPLAALRLQEAIDRLGVKLYCPAIGLSCRHDHALRRTG